MVLLLVRDKHNSLLWLTATKSFSPICIGEKPCVSKHNYQHNIWHYLSFWPMITALKNTLSDSRYFSETPVSGMLTFLTVLAQAFWKVKDELISLPGNYITAFTFSKIVCTTWLSNSLLLSTPCILRLLQVLFRTLSRRQAQVWMSTQHMVLAVTLLKTKLTSCSCSDNFPNTIPWCNVSCSEITQKSPLTKQGTGRVGFFRTPRTAWHNHSSVQICVPLWA